MNYNLYLSALLMAATCCSMVMTYLSWKRRELPIAISYGLGMLAGSFYTFGYAFEIVSTTLDHIRFWLRVEYIGIPFGSVIWIIMVLQYTGRQSLVHRRLITLLLIIPTLTITAHYTNEWHHWYYKSVTLNWSEGFPLVSLVKGPLYVVHVAYSYILFALGTALMFQMYLRANSRMKKQIALMIIGSWGPYGFTLVYLSGVIYMPIDISPFGFVFSGFFYLWGIYQFNMLRLAPLALQKVFESMQDAVIIFDLDNNLTSFNQSAKGIVEGLHKKHIGLPAFQVFTRYPTLLERIIQGPTVDSKIQISGQADAKFYNIHMSAVNDTNQKPVGKMLLLSDVTEMVRSEKKLLENSRQLKELNAFKDRMFNVVAHDIRDPLAVLTNLMELMEEELQTCGESHEEILQEMGQQIQNTFTLVESLLDWFRGQREGMVFHPVALNLSNVVEVNMNLLQIRSARKGIRIRSDIPLGSIVYADKEMLHLVLRNLLSNALKFTESGGIIQLQAERVEGKMIVSIIDTGEGVSADLTDSLFQEAYSITSEGTDGERGFGLGLTLCREFVRLNGGEIWFDSTPAQGSTFFFSIPTPPKATHFMASTEGRG
ncbi:histidine kinase N-terminal 7TM domain-containing protein [Paenibacillus wynnii]|uniref:histidine kinase n=1 Tax=Paenibacillus wynnii TaxID=268407 RepID=A0A098MC82_9BACL|nr:histidine kinase N-terminal 7TM domain-containing protein [Paenibacillus wynnii]KGE20160.1 hypothetical protein PWYN_13080 [Paenibacillus wynnii]